MPKLLKWNNQSGIVAIIPLLLLLAGLGAGLYLVQNPQIFRPKASSTEVQLILKSNDTSSCAEVKNGRETITCPSVKLKLLSLP